MPASSSLTDATAHAATNQDALRPSDMPNALIGPAEPMPLPLPRVLTVVGVASCPNFERACVAVRNAKGFQLQTLGMPERTYLDWLHAKLESQSIKHDRPIAVFLGDALDGRFVGGYSDLRTFLKLQEGLDTWHQQEDDVNICCVVL
jgi:hypothetical protein